MSHSTLLHASAGFLKKAGATWLEDLLSLFFPDHCTGCGNLLHASSLPFCQSCVLSLPRTGFERVPENTVEKLFWGRIPVDAACSIFYFTRDSPLQWMIHHLKYHRRPEVGAALGRLAGAALQAGGRFREIDALLPLPLYPEREKERGYNQSEKICQGIREATGIPVLPKVLARIRKTDSQTKKNRVERWDNVEGSFTADTHQLQGLRHVLLVDDVITTGATLDACGKAILEKSPLKLSICSLAYAHL